MASKKPLLLLVLDGYGYRDTDQHNATRAAKSPIYDNIWQNCPHTLIHTSGMAVGLPEGQMGNSEVGHMTLGAGRVVYQNFTRINKSISDGDFFDNDVYCSAIDKAIASNGAVHILGLLSPGGVHSHEDHMLAMLELAVQRGAKKVYVHAFLDGRDCPPRSAEPSLQRLQDKIDELGCGAIASVCGRFFAMDRDKRWDRVQAAYDLLTQGQAEHSAASAVSALHAAYERDENDEFVKPTVILDSDGSKVSMQDGDVAVSLNFRPDRARQLTYALMDDAFDGFERVSKPKLAEFVMTTEYAADLNRLCSCAYPPEMLNNSFGEYLSKQGLKAVAHCRNRKVRPRDLLFQWWHRRCL